MSVCVWEMSECVRLAGGRERARIPPASPPACAPKRLCACLPRAWMRAQRTCARGVRTMAAAAWQPSMLSRSKLRSMKITSKLPSNASSAVEGAADAGAAGEDEEGEDEEDEDEENDEGAEACATGGVGVVAAEPAPAPAPEDDEAEA
jgi:hypothetical protein